MRINGSILHPELKSGSDWTRGDRPSIEGLDASTRSPLEALWLYDAQKEHASVPGFTRISWQLAAVGAPAELLVGALQTALEEIDHTRKCFALAAGYGNRCHTVEPPLELLVDGMELAGNSLEVLAVESLKDGCLLEGFNSDVAAECHKRCENPVTRKVLLQIATEENSHAEFSWIVLRWALEKGNDSVQAAVGREVRALRSLRRPSAVSAKLQPLIDSADAARLIEHGRIPDADWAILYQKRMRTTQERALEIIGSLFVGPLALNRRLGAKIMKEPLLPRPDLNRAYQASLISSTEADGFRR